MYQFQSLVRMHASLKITRPGLSTASGGCMYLLKEILSMTNNSWKKRIQFSFTLDGILLSQSELLPSTLHSCLINNLIASWMLLLGLTDRRFHKSGTTSPSLKILLACTFGTWFKLRLEPLCILYLHVRDVKFNFNVNWKSSLQQNPNTIRTTSALLFPRPWINSILLSSP